MLETEYSLEILQEILKDYQSEFNEIIYKKPTPVGIWKYDNVSKKLEWNKNMYIITETRLDEDITLDKQENILKDRFNTFLLNNDNTIYGCSICKHDVVGHEIRNYISKMYMGLSTIDYDPEGVDDILDMLLKSSENIINYINK